jgi:ABC-type transport system substrate-binding protein
MILILIRSRSWFGMFFSLVAFIGWAGCSFRAQKEPPGTLHLVSTQKIKGLDPIFADDYYSGTQSSQAYETLLQYHYLKRPYVLIPNLLETMPVVSDDGTVYQFKLKKGVLFQDDPCFQSTGGKGREMTAEDVVYSLKRLADPQWGASGWWILDNKVMGLNVWRDQASRSHQANYSQDIEGLKIVGRYEFQIKLTQRSTQFLSLLAMPFAGVVAREAVEAYGKEFINHAVGTGPFRLLEYNPNSKIVWTRNPSYHGDIYPTEGSTEDRESGLLQDAGKSLPFADQVVVHVFVEQQPMWLSFLSGKLDATGIPKDSFSTAMTSTHQLSSELVSKGIRLIKKPGLDVTHMTFNMADPILGKNRYLRQAISLAYDQNTFNEIFYNGAAIAAQGPIPPGIDGHSKTLRNPYRQFSVAKAKELLAKAGFPGGRGLPVFEYASIAGSLGRQEAEFISKSLETIGVKLSVNSYSWPQFLEVVKNKKAQLWQYAWAGDYPDGENFLQLFYSKNASPGQNDANYANPEFDRLYEKSLTLAEGQERTKIYEKMVEILVQDCPWIFGAHPLSYVLVQKWLRNYQPNDFSHSNYKYYRVDPALKTR